MAALAKLWTLSKTPALTNTVSDQTEDSGKGGKDVFSNLKGALAQKHISIKALASFLGVSEKTAHNKLSGSTEFTYPEAKRISQELFPEYVMTYLFKEDKD